MGEDMLVMKGITKIYPNGVMANDRVDFSVRKGEIHALMGENGAGKSTLMNILFGEYQPEEGTITLNGKQVTIESSSQAIALGIGMVHQHFMLVNSLTVAQNIYLGIEPKLKNGLVDEKRMVADAKTLAEQYNFKIEPEERIADIPVGMRQKVEILKALARGAEILILDEPTAVLTPQETDELFHELELFREAGHTIIFISHKLKEIKQICDRITIMKNGRSVGTYDMREMDVQKISRMMVGRDVVTGIEKTPAQPGKTLLKVWNLSCCNDEGAQVLKNVSFSVRGGEIVGVAGVEGNGQTELVECITGSRREYTGKIELAGRSNTGCSVARIRHNGLGHIPEDRMTQGLAGDASIEENLIADKLGQPSIGWGPFLLSGKIRALSQQLVEDFQIKCASGKQLLSMLSGGNMQKVVVAREVSSQPQVMVANQPTRGVDVGASEFIHEKLLDLRDSGKAVFLVSADLNEVIELSDSLMVLYGGEIVAWFPDASKVDERELGYYMLGLKKQSAEEIRGAIHEEEK